jgi:hypothetical protein
MKAGWHSVDVCVLPDAIDYSICTRPFDFTGTKELKPRMLYGVNCRIVDVQIVQPAARVSGA